MIQRVYRVFVLLMLTGLTGCFGGGAPVPQDTYYRLPSAATAQTRDTGSLLGIIAVSSLHSEALYRERAILYSDSDKELSLKRYHYHHWTAILNNLVQEHLIDYLRNSTVARQVVRYGQQNHIDAHVTGHIKRFERVVNNQGDKVVVELELQIELLGREKQRIYYNSYKTEQKPVSDSMQSVVEAFANGLAHIYQRFVSDLRAQKLI